MSDLKVSDLLKLVAALQQPVAQPATTPQLPSLKGRYGIVRTRNEGLNAGTVVDFGLGWVQLENARRIWRFDAPSSTCPWYEGVAELGLPEEAKISAPVDKFICEDYSLTLCTPAAAKSIQAATFS